MDVRSPWLLAGAVPAQTPAGGEFRVNTYTTGRQYSARPAMEPDGDFVVVWASYPQYGSGFGVFGQRFAAPGTPRGGEFQINTYTAQVQAFPAVAVGSRGDFVVVWVSADDGSGRSIQGRRYDTAGNPIGGEFLINSFTPGNVYWPRIGRASDGRFVVSWANRNDGSSHGIAARRFDASGNPVGSEFVVNTYTTGIQTYSNVAVEADGDFVVVWEDDTLDRDGSGTAIFGQRYDASANPLGSEFLVNSYTTGSQRRPSVSVSAAGGFVVAWISNPGDGSSYGIFSRRFDAAGNAAGNDFVVNTYTTGYQGGLFGQVAHDARGNFVVTWGSYDGSLSGSFAQRFDASASRRGAEFQVNTYTTGIQTMPSVASDAVGNFVVTWASANQDGHDLGTFAQRFGGLAPAALSVNSGPGNLVLEPGETVDVRPSWRNFNGAGQTFNGTLTNISGPAGAIYAITDAAGNYGTVANGATAPCVDCYAVSVSNPPTRPAVHWDAAAVESILPDTQGQQKQWILHVGAQLHRRAHREPVLSLHRDPAAPPDYRRLRRDQLLPGQLHLARTDGRLRPGREGRRRLHSARLHDTDFRRRPREQPVLPVHRRAGPSWRGHRVRRRQLLPGESGHARADGGLRPGHAGGPALHSGRLHDADVRGRPREQPVLPVHRGVGASWRGHRVRRRSAQLLPGESRHPRADGRLHQRDLRPDAVRPLNARGVFPPGRMRPFGSASRVQSVGFLCPRRPSMTKPLFRAGLVSLVMVAPAMAQTPAGGEFRVNTYTTNRQTAARAAMEPDGDFVVVWQSYTQDGNNYGVFGQRFAASGAPRGSEFRINTYTTAYQRQPAVAVGSRGDFVVVWLSTQDGSGPSIQGQRYDASGSAIGGEFLVNTFTTGNQNYSRVGRASDGRFVVSWISNEADGDSSGIAARRFDASGNPIGSEFLVNTYTTGMQRLGDLAVAANGDFVAVWEDENDRDGSRSAIFGQRYDASGNPLGGEFQVNSYTTGYQQDPAVSVSPAGGFVVAWTSDYGDGSSNCMFARRFDASGTALGTDFVVNTYTTGYQGRLQQAGRSRRPRQFRRHLGRRRRRQRVRLLCPALQRHGRPPWRRVPGQHLHHGPAERGVGRLRFGGQLRRRLGQSRRPGRERLRSLCPALRRPGARRAHRRSSWQRGAGARGDGGRAAHVAEHQRRRADVRRRTDQHHWPVGRRLRDH